MGSEGLAVVRGAGEAHAPRDLLNGKAGACGVIKIPQSLADLFFIKFHIPGNASTTKIQALGLALQVQRNEKIIAERAAAAKYPTAGIHFYGKIRIFINLWVEFTGVM